MEKIRNIVHNTDIGKAFYDLCDRWLDESKTEDINEYGKQIVEIINKHYPDYNVELISSTEEPFGVVISIEYQKVHLFIRFKGHYAFLSSKPL